MLAIPQRLHSARLPAHGLHRRAIPIGRGRRELGVALGRGAVPVADLNHDIAGGRAVGEQGRDQELAAEVGAAERDAAPVVEQRDRLAELVRVSVGRRCGWRPEDRHLGRIFEVDGERLCSSAQHRDHSPRHHDGPCAGCGLCLVASHRPDRAWGDTLSRHGPDATKACSRWEPSRTNSCSTRAVVATVIRVDRIRLA